MEDMTARRRKGRDSDGALAANGATGRVSSARSVCSCWDCIGTKLDSKGSTTWTVADPKVGMSRTKEGPSA